MFIFVEKLFSTVTRKLQSLVKLVINSSILLSNFHSFSFLSIAYLLQVSYTVDMSKDSIACARFSVLLQLCSFLMLVVGLFFLKPNCWSSSRCFSSRIHMQLVKEIGR
jgi:hypothetical protein